MIIRAPECTSSQHAPQQLRRLSDSGWPKRCAVATAIGPRLLCQLGYERLPYKSRANYADGDGSTVCFIGHGRAAINVAFRSYWLTVLSLRYNRLSFMESW